MPASWNYSVHVQTSISSPSLDRITSPPSISGSPASAPKAARPANAALQILIQAAARATRAVQQRVEMTQLQSKLESCRSFAALQASAEQQWGKPTKPRDQDKPIALLFLAKHAPLLQCLQ